MIRKESAMFVIYDRHLLVSVLDITDYKMIVTNNHQKF